MAVSVSHQHMFMCLCCTTQVFLPAAAPASYGHPPTGPGKTCSVRRRLDISLGSAAGLSVSAGRSSALVGRTTLTNGRRASVSSSRKYLFADKENSASATGKALTPASSGASQQTLPTRAALALGNPAGRRPLAPMTEAEVASLPWGPRVLQRSMRHLLLSGLAPPAALRTGSHDGNVLPRGGTPPAAAGSATAVDPKVQPGAAQQVALPAGSWQAPLPNAPVRRPLEEISSTGIAGANRMSLPLASSNVMSKCDMPARTAVVVHATPSVAQQSIGAHAQKVSPFMLMLVVTHIMYADRSFLEASCVNAQSFLF